VSIKGVLFVSSRSAYDFSPEVSVLPIAQVTLSHESDCVSSSLMCGCQYGPPSGQIRRGSTALVQRREAVTPGVVFSIALKTLVSD
jgi:hypothetical protein